MHSDDILMLVFLVGAVVVVLVAMGLNHSRKLAEIAARSKAADDEESEGLTALQTSVDELRTQLHAQMIQIDTLVGRQAKLLDSPSKSEDIQNRLGADEPRSSQNRTNMEQK